LLVAPARLIDMRKDISFIDELYQWQNTSATIEDVDTVKRNPCLNFIQKRKIIKLIKKRS
jgi:hypothetical protein